MKYKLVIFDFDGTLFATHEAIIHCVIKTFEHYQQTPPNREAIFHLIQQGIGLEEAVTTMGDYQSDPALWIKTYREIYRTCSDQLTQPFEHGNEIFSALYDAGVKIAVVSNKGFDSVKSTLDKFDLSSFVALIVGDQPGITRKPDPMIFNEIILKKFNDLQSQDVLVVGDTMVDIQFAKNIGADSCWASFGYGHAIECIKTNPTYTINKLNELQDILIK